MRLTTYAIPALFSVLLLLGLLPVSAAHAQSFSCSIGKPACLGFGEKVVDSSAVCFSSYECSSGFVCRSDYTGVVDDYNDLVDRYNEKSDAIREIVEYAEKCRAHEESPAASRGQFRTCVSLASSMQAVQNCLAKY